MATAKDLTREMLEKYVGGQFKTKLLRDHTHRGEISEVVQDGQKMRIRVAWAAVKSCKVWRKDPASEFTFVPALCQYRMDVGVDVEVIRIDCPSLAIAMTFYPKGHRKNIRLEDVQPKPC